MASERHEDVLADGLDVGGIFKDPEGYYQEKEPTFAEHQMLSGRTLRVRLVGSHPLYGDLLWNAGRTSAEYLEQRAAELVEGKDILEIGAAAGVPSIVCAIKGARTVVMTDYPDPELVDNMRQNAASSAPLIPERSHLHVAGYKWGASTEEIMSFLPPGSQGFDLLIMADVVYSHREHGNLISTMQRTLKKSPDAIALVIFTPYQPWLLPKTEKFFPLAEENGFKVTKLFEKLMDKVLFENDPGDEKLRRTVFGYEIRWAPDRLDTLLSERSIIVLILYLSHVVPWAVSASRAHRSSGPSHMRPHAQEKSLRHGDLDSPRVCQLHETMPLIILTGYPCSGLTYRAHQLAALLESVQDRFLPADTTTATDSSQKPRYKIHVVPSHDLSHPRTVYDNARTEKEARAVVFARVKRALGRDTIVLVDGMNYIKGWRYQLWCEAKAVGTTCCVVHVGTPIDTCVAINNARLRRQGQQVKQHPDGQSQPANGGDNALENAETPAPAQDTTVDLAEVDNEEPYPPELLDNLIFRYEEPSTHSRWDKPLFTVLWSDASPPVEDIWTAITGIQVQKPTTTTPLSSLLSTTTTTSESTTTTAPPPPPSDTASIATATTTGATRGTLPRPKIKPHQATVQPAATDPTALYSFEKRTSNIISAIRAFAMSNPSASAALAQSPDSKGITIPVPESSIPVFIPAHIATGATTDELAGVGGILALPRLQRLRRQWIGLNRAYVGQNHGQGKGTLRIEQVGDAFVRFLNAELAGENVPEEVDS